MINFIVLEDNKFHAQNTENIILKYMMKNKYEFDVLTFTDATSKFWNKVENRDANYIYILDFELPSTTAIDVARRIRKTDWTSPIIVYSVNGGMAYETLKKRLQILDFVNKQYQAEENLFEVFDICIDQLRIKDNFKYKIGKVDYTIDFDKILYFYKDTYERKSIIITDKNSFKIPLSLTAIKSKLPDYFKFSHKSCIINTKRVLSYAWTEPNITFDNNTTTQLLSKTHKKELVQ